MAQPVAEKIAYLGSVILEGGNKYTPTQILAMFNDAADVPITAGDVDYLINKTKRKRTADGKEEELTVAINGTPSISIEYNEINSFYTGIALTYQFSRECIVVLAKDVT